jgi:small nuclear ribonucleoprotein (snRNP)-like protein
MCVFAVNGLLKGYDALMNLVLDEVQEVLRGMDPLFLFLALNATDGCKQTTKAIPPLDPSVSSLREERYWCWLVLSMEVRKLRIRSYRLRNEDRILEIGRTLSYEDSGKYCWSWEATNNSQMAWSDCRQMAWNECPWERSCRPVMKAMIRPVMQKT